MKKITVLFAILACVCISAMLLSSCNDGTAPGSTAPATGEVTSTATSTPEATTTPEETYVLPESGILKVMPDGYAPFVEDGRNPSFVGDSSKIVIFFEFALRRVGLNLNENTEITFSVKKPDNSVVESTATLDNSVSEIKNEYGYIGLCFDLGFTLEKYESATIVDLRFKDANGNEYGIKNRAIFKGISYYGINASEFDKYLGDTVTTTVAKQSVKQTATINGTNFTFNITLGRWDGYTSAKQIVTVSRLFWSCYPRMYARFGEVGQSPTTVTLDIENGGYGIASAGGNNVHIHDKWLYNNKNDYDCLTHEFAHVIQNGWDGNYCEYSDYIERFADCCRYLYAFEEGKYNDPNWTLNTVSGESTREQSVRFLVWLDYFYSNEKNDILVKYFDACRSKKYQSSQWDKAWADIFKGTDLEGKNIETVWSMYESSEFAKLSANGITGIPGQSALLKKYNVRAKLK